MKPKLQTGFPADQFPALKYIKLSQSTGDNLNFVSFDILNKELVLIISVS